MICTAEGGYLAIVNNETEIEVLKQLFAKYPTQTIFSTHKDVAFVGIREWPDERSWYTVHGQTLKEVGHYRWNAEPDNANLAGETQNCGVISRTALYDDFWCNTKLAFICEKDI